MIEICSVTMTMLVLRFYVSLFSSPKVKRCARLVTANAEFQTRAEIIRNWHLLQRNLRTLHHGETRVCDVNVLRLLKDFRLQRHQQSCRPHCRSEILFRINTTRDKDIRYPTDTVNESDQSRRMVQNKLNSHKSLFEATQQANPKKHDIQIYLGSFTQRQCIVPTRTAVRLLAFSILDKASTAV